jgi:hypothetical protein
MLNTKFLLDDDKYIPVKISEMRKYKNVCFNKKLKIKL